MLKGDISAYVKDSIKCRNEYADISAYVGKKKDAIKELEMKVRQAKNDRDMLFRDCSTFEVNFCKSDK